MALWPRFGAPPRSSHQKKTSLSSALQGKSGPQLPGAARPCLATSTSLRWRTPEGTTGSAAATRCGDRVPRWASRRHAPFSRSKRRLPDRPSRPRPCKAPPQRSAAGRPRGRWGPSVDHRAPLRVSALLATAVRSCRVRGQASTRLAVCASRGPPLDVHTDHVAAGRLSIDRRGGAVKESRVPPSGGRGTSRP